MTQNVYAAFHKELYWHSSIDAAELDAILRQFYQGICMPKIVKIYLGLTNLWQK